MSDANRLPTMMVRIQGGTEMRINVADYDPSQHEQLGFSKVPGTSIVPNIVVTNPLEALSALERMKKVRETTLLDDLLKLQEWEGKLKTPSKEVLGVLEAAIGSLKAQS